MRKILILTTLGFASAACVNSTRAEKIAGLELIVEMHAIDASGIGASIGQIEIGEDENGIVLRPALTDLTPGAHGIHVHQNGNCAPADKDGIATAGQAAGEHYDPAATGKHAGPMGRGHAGDLPRLMVNSDGNARTGLTAPRLRLADLMGRSIIVHVADDNYADQPGGARIACGVIASK